MTAIASEAGLFGTVAHAAILRANAHLLHLPAELASNSAGEIRFHACFARTPGGSDLRTVHIHGPRIEIVNLFLFPPPHLDLPLYAMEFVVFGRKPVVCVMDSRPLSGTSWSREIWEHTMQEAHRQHPSLVDAGDPPEWYVECRSGLDFFCRPAETLALFEALQCHDRILASLLEAEVACPELGSAATAMHGSALAEYKHHHRMNSPGLPFLNRSFGRDWTDRFLETALFA